jgi:dTDP-4-dehydrorhamnose reductase
MKVLVFGGSGMLGHVLVRKWSERYDVSETIRGKAPAFGEFVRPKRVRTFEDVDVFDPAKVEAVIAEVEPDVIFNAVGIIKQLPSSKDTIRTLTVNSIFPHRLAGIAERCGARVITLGTDCVFSGNRGMYTESDVPDAVDLYGISKRLGELDEGNCLTLRTSIIGPEAGTSHSLLEWFLSNAGGRVRGFRRAIYSGFPTVVLAGIVAGIIDDRPDLRGLYHLSSDPINKFDLLRLIRDAYNVDIEIDPDDELTIDRSLDSTRFRGLTGFVPDAWPDLVRIMAADDAVHGQNRRNRK